MKVRIVKCSAHLDSCEWYSKDIGKVFKVLNVPGSTVWFYNDEHYQDGTYILIEDTEPVTEAQPTTTQPLGKKYDQGKPRYSLLPPNALEEVVKVLTFGSNKYEDFNWMNLDNPNDRFFSAASRHMWAWQKGEKLDSETGYNHLASAITNLMFILELELLNANKSS